MSEKIRFSRAVAELAQRVYKNDSRAQKDRARKRIDYAIKTGCLTTLNADKDLEYDDFVSWGVETFPDDFPDPLCPRLCPPTAKIIVAGHQPTVAVIPSDPSEKDMLIIELRERIGQLERDAAIRKRKGRRTSR